MPYVYEDIVQGDPRSAQTVPSPRRDVLTETFAQAYEENPLKAVQRFLELSEEQVTGPFVSAETARARLNDAGMDDIIITDTGISEAALRTLMERKRIEKRRQDVLSRAQGGVVEGAERLGVGVLTTLADPLGAGLNFVPVVGEVRYARWLAASKTLLGRVAVRAAAGAIEGAAGNALAEIPVYAMRRQEQSDYDMADSLLNVAFGGVAGAGLHATVGTIGELFSGLPERQIPRAVNLSASERVLEQRLAEKVARNVDRSIREYASLEGADGGRVLNTDLARELSPEYRSDRTQSAAVHEPASWLVKRMYERKLAEAPKEGEDALVVFSAGGTGAGKTTGLEMVPAAKRAQIIYDTNMNGTRGAIEKIDKALAAGKQVVVQYTWRDPVDALVNGALPRAKRMGRTVPLDEHAKTHVGAASTIKELAAHYADNPRVEFTIVDNSHGKGAARFGDLSTPRELDYNTVREQLSQALEAERGAGRISEAVYRGTVGSEGVRARARPADRRQPESPRLGGQVTTAERVSASRPEVQQAALRAAVGQAADGRPIDVGGILGTGERPLPDTRDFEAAQHAAEDALASDVDPTIEANLKAATDEAAIAEADAKMLSERLGLKGEDAEMAEVKEGAALAERWARVAELATVCLVRGG